jgi:hypothetical protein
MTGTSLTPARGIVLVALVLLGVGWALAPRSAPPLYDGVGFPDEPYRFVQRPPGTRVTKAPTTARATAGIIAGYSGQLSAASAESAPQVSVTIPEGMLRIPSGRPPVTLLATPEKASTPPPAGKYLWSNVYDITVSPPATVVDRPNFVATLILRAATAQQPLPVIAHLDGGRWTPLPTGPAGRDVYAADLSSLGRFAVLGDAPLDLSTLRTGGSRSGGSRAGIFTAVGVIAAVLALFVAGQWRRARRRRRAKEHP